MGTEADPSPAFSLLLKHVLGLFAGPGLMNTFSLLGHSAPLSEYPHVLLLSRLFCCQVRELLKRKRFDQALDLISSSTSDPHSQPSTPMLTPPAALHR